MHRGLGRTGVVGVLEGKWPGQGAIGLRCDMDALPITERTGLAYASRHQGQMHACGHDGHTAMLLAAARHLAETRDFAGTLYFIFQPAEEGAAGAAAMIRDGLFERFPMDAVYGLHNWPGLPVGQAAVKAGPMMAAADSFDVTVEGAGSHAAMPQFGRDPVLAAAHMITALQQITAREIDPNDRCVVSVSLMQGGHAHNVIPDTVELGGTARTFRESTRAYVERRIADVCQGVAQACGVAANCRYRRGYPPTVNHTAESEICAGVLSDLVGKENVLRDPEPSMGGEDFAFMLEQKPGAYIWLGSGDAQHQAMLHSSRYDFNDRILASGASYWVSLATRVLAPES